MANIKDLIVNGTSRFLGKIYGKIANAYVADVEGVTVAPTSTTYSDSNITISNYSSYSIGSASGASCSISIDPGVTRIIMPIHFEPTIITGITAKSGSFVNGQKLEFYGCVKLSSSITPYYGSAGYSESGVNIVNARTSITSNPSAGTFPEETPYWHEYVYWNGQWYGKAYNIVYATNQLTTDVNSGSLLPVQSSVVKGKFDSNAPKNCYTYNTTLSASTSVTLPSGYNRYNLYGTFSSEPGYILTYKLPLLSTMPPFFMIDLKTPGGSGISSANTATIVTNTNANVVLTQSTYIGSNQDRFFFINDGTTLMLVVRYSTSNKQSWIMTEFTD